MEPGSQHNTSHQQLLTKGLSGAGFLGFRLGSLWVPGNQVVPSSHSLTGKALGAALKEAPSEAGPL